MFIKIDLKDDVNETEAATIARGIIAALEFVDEMPGEVTAVSLGGHHEIWISDEEDARRNS